MAGVSGAAGRSFTYLASGQLASDTSGVARTFDYDADGRMVAANDNGVLVASYDYDAMGHQVSKTAGGQAVHFIYDPFGRLIAEHDGATGAALREYVFLGWMPVAMLDHSSGSPVTYFIHTDQVMQPQMMTDASGAVVWNRIATPYGVEVSASGALTQSLRFPGQRENSETGFSQNWHRDYDPLLGRYVQSDPLGLIDGPSTYAYVGDKPSAYFDSTGLGKIGFMIKTVKTIKKWCTREEAKRALSNGEDIYVEGASSSRKAKQLAKEEFGENAARHDPHAPGERPHYQHRNGGRGHIFYGAAASMTAVGNFGDNPITEVADLFNPASDVADILELIGDITDDGSQTCDACSE